jgi:filamentous hemagglutinin family protein
MSKKIRLHPISAAVLARRLPYALALLAPGLALAGPSGGQVVAGQVGISTPNVNTTVINQGSQSAIINWQQFNVGSSEYVTFNQPNASAAVLNRIVGGSASEILGTISANGRVFLINPQGVIFGKSATVDVGSLVATTMNISDHDFLSGRYVFTNGSAAEVSNAGNIHAANGGFVVLAGDYVNNTGVVRAKLGDVVLASGSAMTLDLNGDGLINFSVDRNAISDRAGVANLGELAAEGGTVIMTAKVARGLANTAVNNSGLISARGIEENAGDIYLTATGGDVLNAGTLDASGVNGHNAGDIRINSDRDIALASGSGIFASGAAGGDLRVVAERHLGVEQGAYTDVSRLAQSGRAGFAEWSGHQGVTIRDIVQLGDHGTLLIDPTAVSIGYGGGADIDQFTLQSQLKNSGKGSNVMIVASNSITVLGNLQGNTLDGHSTSPGYGGGLSLRIGSCAAGGPPGNCGGAFTPGTAGSINFVDSNTLIDIAGDIFISGGTASGTVTTGNLNSGGRIDVLGAGDISTGYLHAATGLSVNSSAGNVTFTDIALYNSSGSSAVINTDIDASVTASVGSINGSYIFVNNSQDQFNSAAGMAATLNLTAGIGIKLTGVNKNTGTGISVIGGGGSGSGGAISTVASAKLTAGTAVDVAGHVAVNGLDYFYADPATGQKIHAGGAEFIVAGDSFTARADVDVSGEGFATFDITGHNGITLMGNSHVTATAASITTPSGGNTLNLQYGFANVLLTADQNNSKVTPTGSIVKAGNISVVGPNAIVAITGGSVEIGNSNNLATDFGVSADANTNRQTTSVIDNSSNLLYQSNAGSALVSILTGGANGANQGILTHGGIVADGPSSQINLLAARDVNIGGSILATGRGYTESGDPSLNTLFPTTPTSGGTLASLTNDLPFRLKQGTLNWGGARVFVGSASFNGPQGSAGALTVNGGLSVQGVGHADADLLVSRASIGGDVSVFASQGTLKGTFTSQETINGFLYNVTRVIGSASDANGSVTGSASYGKGHFALKLSDNTADSQILGKIDVRGNSATASINGGHNVTVGGDILVGGFRSTNPQFDTPPPVYAEQVSYAAATTTTQQPPPAVAGHTESINGDINAFAVGFEQALSGNFSAGTHSITVEGTGVAAVVMNAAGIQTGQISITGHAGSLSFQPANGVTTPTFFNDTALQLNAAGGTANTGGVSVTGEGNMHVGGKFNAGANQVGLLATGAINSQIPGALLGINHPLDGGNFPMATQAPRDLGALDVATTGSIFFKFGADSSLSGLSLKAGNDLTVNGDINATGRARSLQVGANPTFIGGAGSASILNANLLATGTVTIQGSGNNIEIANSSFGLPTGTAAGTALNVNLSASNDASISNTNFNVSSLVVTSTQGNIVIGNSTASSGGNIAANTVKLLAAAANRDVAISNALIVTNGGVTGGDGDLNIQAGSGGFHILNSTLSDLSGGTGLLGASGSSTIDGSTLLFNGLFQAAVTGADSSLSVVNSSIDPASLSTALIAKAATVPGNVIFASSGNMTIRANIHANRLSLNSGGELRLGGTTAVAGQTSLNGTKAVIDDSNFFLNADSLGVTSSSGYIDLTNSSITVGTGLATGVDGALLGQDDAMRSHISTFAPVSTSPNAAFIATGTGADPNGLVGIGNLTLLGDYLYVQAKSAGFAGVLSHLGTGPLFYNFVPRTPNAGIDASGIAGLINRFNSPPATSLIGFRSTSNTALTLAFGSSSSTGPILAGSAQTPINVPGTNTNFVFVTTGAISGFDTIKTGGHVVLLQGNVLTIDGVVQGQPPPPPQVDPVAQQQAHDATGAAADVVSGGKPPAPGDHLGSDIGGANSIGKDGDQIENHTRDTNTDKSCT